MTPTEPVAVLAPFGLLRVAGLPADSLTPLTLPASRHIVADLVEIGEALQPLQGAVTGLLHALVPRLDDDPALRRQAIGLKRDVHNDRTRRQDAAVLDRIAARLDAHEKTCLLSWRDLAQRRAALHEALDGAVATDLDAASRALAAAVEVPNLRGGIATSSDSFAATLDSGSPSRWRDPDHRDARTLVAYLARAAVKTSPLSSLTTLGLLRNHALRPGPERRLRSHAVPLLRWTLLQACAQEIGLAPAFRYEAVATWQAKDGRLRALLPRVVITGDFFWRSETPTDLTLYTDHVASLAAAGAASYAAVIATLPGREPHLTLQRLLDTGIVRPVAPWTDDDPEPLLTLSGALQDLATPRGTAVSALIRAVAEAEAQLQDPDLARRRAARSGLRSHTIAALGDLGVAVPRWATSGKLAYEDVADVSLPFEATRLPTQIEDDLQHLAGLVRPGLFPTRLYEEVVQAFVGRFGRGGTCARVMAFLDDFLAQPGIVALLQGVVAHDVARISDSSGAVARGPRSLSSAPPSLTVLFQLAAADREAMARGEYLVVVNQFSAGLGGLLARLAPLFPGPHGLAEDLRGWLQGCYPEALVAELLPARDVNSLEDASRGLFPKLRWPADGPTRESSPTVGTDELRLIHDQRGNALVLHTAAGRPVATPNLGTVPDHLVFGPLRLLFTIANPWVVGSPLSDRGSTLAGHAATVTEMTFRPRDQRGRLVLRRARWLTPGHLFPLRAKGEGEGAYLLRVAAWRRAHALPEEVFVSVEGTLANGIRKERKPRWVCFSSLHSLAAVRPVVAENLGGTLALAEALPARNQHWARDHEGQPRATELMALLRWDHDGATGPRRGEAHHGR